MSFKKLFAPLLLFVAALAFKIPEVHAAVVAHVPDVLIHALGVGGGMWAGIGFLSTNTDALLRNYMDDTYAVTLIQDRPFFDRITKKSGVGGDGVKIPINVGYGGGQGGDFPTALANAQAGGAVRAAFLCEPAKAFGVNYVENSEVPFTQTDDSAIDMLTDNTRGAMELAAQNYSAIMFGDGFGTLGTVGTAVNTSGNLWTITFVVLTDAMKFNLNNKVVQKVLPNSAALDTGVGTVTGVNQIAGQIQLDVAATGMTPTAGRVLGLQGQMLASTAVSTFPGVFGWVPPITSRTNGVIGDTFLGVPRLINSSGVAVGGWAIDGRAKPIAPTVNVLAGLMANLKNSKPDTLVMNPTTGAKLAIELDTKVMYDMPSESVAGIFYSGFYMMTPAGRVEVLLEPSCPSDKCLLTKAKSWIYGYPDRPFAPTSLKGNIMIESYDQNRTRFAVTCAGYFYTTNPAASGVVTVSP
jgi:hypothetical protein